MHTGAVCSGQCTAVQCSVQGYPGLSSLTAFLQDGGWENGTKVTPRGTCLFTNKIEDIEITLKNK